MKVKPSTQSYHQTKSCIIDLERHHREVALHARAGGVKRRANRRPRAVAPRVPEVAQPLQLHVADDGFDRPVARQPVHAGLASYSVSTDSGVRGIPYDEHVLTPKAKTKTMALCNSESLLVKISLPALQRLFYLWI